MSFRLNFKQRDEATGLESTVFGFGSGWYSPWLSWVHVQSHFLYRMADVHVPGGGTLSFTLDSGTDVGWNYYSNGRLTALRTGGTLTGFKLDLPNGKQYVYQQAWTIGGYTDDYYLSSSVDSEGFTTYYAYTTDQGRLRLTQVKDHNNELLYSLSYTNRGALPNLVASVTDRFGRSAELAYSLDATNGPHLARIIDAAQLTSTVAYTSEGWPQSLTTPYGITTFSYLPDGGLVRYLKVTKPNNGVELSLFSPECTNLFSGLPWLNGQAPPSLVPGNLPTGALLGTTNMHQINSFYWNEKQSVGVPEDIYSLTTNHMNKARMRHWLDDCPNIAPDFALSAQREPSTDDGGTIWGGMTWYDYPGKDPALPHEKGTNVMPWLVARKLPDGSTWYESYTRNSWGKITGSTNTYGLGSPAATRIYTYHYAADGLDLLEVRRPGNEPVLAFTYNTRHQVLTSTRWPDGSTAYTDTWTYDSQGRPYTFTTAAGQTKTFTYSAYSGSYPGYLSGTTEAPVSRTENFTWLNGYIRTNQDYRGLTRTFTRDGLNRLTQVDYPAHDGLAASSVQYSYTLVTGHGFNTSGPNTNILHVTAVKDRRDRWTYYDRDRLGRLTRVTDPLNHSTSYTYCGCGSPDSITDARNKTTTFFYNNCGWKTDIVYADNTWESFGYDAFGRMTSRTDSLGTRNYAYNNQGLLTTVTTAYGTERSVSYNVHDQPTTEVDANGVSVTKAFDRLGRSLTRAIPGQGTEYLAYSARGLTNYTGPDSKVTRYQFDQATRKTSETTPKNENIGYTYNAGGDLLTLTDGRSKVTTWTYDIEGLVRTKKYDGQTFANLEYSYDLNQRLAWRKFWSDAVTSKQTTYSYDDAGNLLGINYPTSPDVTFTYNEVNKPLTMATVGLGTSTFTYTDAENAAGESGLWVSDAVSYGYHPTAPGLRTALTITQPPGPWAQTYGFDSARRLQTVVAPSGSFAYTYKGPGTLWTNLALPNAAAITNAFDTGGRMSSTRLRNSGGTILNRHDYLYNPGGQRQQQTVTNGAYTTYGYDNDGQLTSSLGYSSNGIPVASEQLGFGYDAGWNMTSRSVNGSPATYTVNDRNQVTMMTGPDYFTNDVNGNLTYWGSQSGWQRNLSYDDENRLVGVTVPGYYIGSYQYDGLSRLRVRTEQRWNGSSWVSSTIRYLYDGMCIVQERDGSNVPQVTYTRGKDLSGTLEGAGGIGGLLARSHGYSGGNWSTHNFYHADALGNITYLVSSAQAMVANYRYDPYGRTLSSGGSLATANVFRFSSKLAMDVSAMTLYYYGFRFYDAGLQRWINRDPIGEWGGLNLFRFCLNAPLTYRDLDGLWPDGGFPIDIQGINGHGPTISGPISGLQNYFFNFGQPAKIGWPLDSILQGLQKEKPWPETATPENLTISDYGCWKSPFSSLYVWPTLGQFRYINDGKRTTISDFYGFPLSQTDWSGGTVHHNAPLHFIVPGSPYPVTGSWPTPKPK